MEDVERVVEVGLAGREPAGALQLHPFAQPRAVITDHRLQRREARELLGPGRPVTRLDQPAREPAEALGLDDHQDGSAAKKISSAVACLTAGPDRLVEHLQQRAGLLAGLEGRPPQRRHGATAARPGHDLQEPPGHAQADPLGLGDGGELVLLVGGDLDGVPEPLLEGLDLGLPLGESSLEFVDAGPGRGAVDGLGDLPGLAVQRLPRLLAVLGHPGDVAVLTAEDGEGAGDALRDRGHGGSLRRGRPGDHPHDCTRPDGNCDLIALAVIAGEHLFLHGCRERRSRRRSTGSRARSRAGTSNTC